MAKRTTDTGLPRNQPPPGKVHLPDPENSGQFDPALVDPPVGNHGAGDPDITYNPTWETETLPAVPPQDDGQVADPPATPDASGETPEPSHTPDVAAGSGGRVGRPSMIGTAVGLIRAAKDYDDTAGKVAETFRPAVRPDAGESALAFLGGVYNPAADPGYAIRLAEDFERLVNMSQHYARLVQANVDKQSPDPKDVRALYRKLRQIAATHGIDLADNREGS